MNRAIDMKLKVKPVFHQLIHSGAYEGPCRVGDEKALSPDVERARAKRRFKEFHENLKGNLTSDAEILRPVYLEWGEDWVMSESEFEKLKSDLHEVDLFLVARSGLPQYPTVAIAQRYNRPVAMLGQVSSVDISAYLRARGFEGYAPIDFDDLNRLISLLRVRKAIQHTKMLVVTDGGLITVGVVSNLWNLEDLKARFGVDYRCIPSQEIFDQMDYVIEDEQEKAEEITEGLIKNAKKVHIRREHILQSVNFYLAAKSLMEKYGCNAFVMPCFEVCVKRIPAERKVTFCLAHSLLKDEGFPSACEGDTNVLLAMTLLMYLSRKSAYMGNSYIIDKEENIMALHHDVPGLKMKGLDKPDLPYGVRNFTVGGWGATVRYDFSRDKGETVTLARFNPTATKLFVAMGEIVGCGGFDDVGCSLRAHIKVRNVVDLFHKEADFGHHLAMVYGDYTQEVRELGDLIGFDVVES